MIKWIGAVLVMVSAYAIGSLLAGQIKEREKWLKEIKIALFLLDGEVEYHQMPFPEALQLVGERHNGKLKQFLCSLSEELKKKEGNSLQELWRNYAKQFFKDTSLTKQQKEEFGELGVYFMEADCVARKNAIEFYLNRLEEEIVQLRETGADKAYLYRMLGMLGGMFLLVLVL